MVNAFQKEVWLEYEWFPKAGAIETRVWELSVCHPSFCPAGVTAISHEGWDVENKTSIIRSVPTT